MIIVEPGWAVRVFQLDGTSIVGFAVSGPYRNERQQLVRQPVVLEDGSEHPAELCEPAGETLRNWSDYYFPKVYFDDIAYKVVNKTLGGRWSGHLGEYVSVDWKKHVIKSKGLSTFVGSNRVYDKKGCLVADGGEVRKPANEVVQALEPVAWAYQQDELARLEQPIAVAFERLRDQKATPAFIHLPRWAKEIWPADRVDGLPFCEAPFPMLLSGPEDGRYAPIEGIPGSINSQSLYLHLEGARQRWRAAKERARVARELRRAGYGVEANLEIERALVLARVAFASLRKGTFS